MNKLFSFFCTLFFLSSVSVSHSQAKDLLTLSLPESVLTEALAAVLPLEYTAVSKSLQGNLRIIDIGNLQLLDQQLSCRLHLAGDNLKIVTEIADQKISLNVGSVELDFKTKASLRFDTIKQTLYITPVIEEVTSVKDDGGGDIANTIVQLINGQEFPVSVKDIDPVVAQAGVKTLTIATRIADIRSQEKWLQLFLEPRISAK
jgi:hypothetical protein